MKSECPTAEAWYEWALRMLLMVGSALVLAGVIFFFAYNWQKMGRFLKLGLVQGGIIGCVVAAHFTGTTRLSGKILLTCASVLVGVLLAVYGQIYQTGADAYELFAGWSALIIGWVIISEFAGLWVVWLVVLNTALILYWTQVCHPAYGVRYEWLCLFLALLNGAALALREKGFLAGLEWLKGRWLRGLFLTAILLALSIPTIHLVTDLGDTEGLTVLGGFVWVLTAAGCYLCYRYALHDMIPLALVVMNACVVVVTLIGKIIFEMTGRGSEAECFLALAVVVIAVVSAAAFWLKKAASEMTRELSGGETS